MHSYQDYLEKARNLKKYDISYYSGAPLVSDHQYDLLLQELELIEKLHPEWKVPWSSTNKVGFSGNARNFKIKHGIEMLSIRHTYNLLDVKKFISLAQEGLQNHPFVLVTEYKVDGVAISIRYENKALKWIATRGNGVCGEDVTKNMVTSGVPLTLDYDGVCEIRGEAFINKENFCHMNKLRRAQELTEWNNPRNLTAGSLLLKDVNEFISRNVEFIAYDVWTEEPYIDSHLEAIRWLDQQLLPTVPIIGKHKTYEDVTHVIETASRDMCHQKFMVDGIVLKVDSYKSWSILGQTDKFRKSMLAYKYSTVNKRTLLKDIVLSVGKTGIITPVAELLPVYIDGSTISRCSLHNMNAMLSYKFHIGDMVFVDKAGGIIPIITGIDFLYREQNNIDNLYVWNGCCPVCDVKIYDNVDDVCTDQVCCTNKECIGQKISQTLHFFSKGGIDLYGIGKGFITKCFEKQLVVDSWDFFGLTKETIMCIDGVGEQLANTLFNTLNAGKYITLKSFLKGLAIPSIGSKYASVLANHFVDLDHLEEANTDDLSAIHGLGVGRIRQIMWFFSSNIYQGIKDKIRLYGIEICNDIKSDMLSYAINKQVVITGTLSMTRKDFEEYIYRKFGVLVQEHVSKNTDYLIVGEKPSVKKLQAANNTNTPTIKEQQFIAIMKITEL